MMSFIHYYIDHGCGLEFASYSINIPYILFLILCSIWLEVNIIPSTTPRECQPHIQLLHWHISFRPPLSSSSILIICCIAPSCPAAQKANISDLKASPPYYIRICFMILTLCLQFSTEIIFNFPPGAFLLAFTCPSISTPGDTGNRPSVSYHLMVWAQGNTVTL